MYLFSIFYVIIYLKNYKEKVVISTLELILIALIRYLINGFFTFSIFSNSKDSAFAKVFMPSIIYTIFLISFKKFINDSPIISLISTITIFGCLLLINKSKSWKHMITYSLFMSCLLEYIHFLIFRLLSIIIDALGIAEVTSAQPERLLVGRAIILLLYSAIVLSIYKFAKIDIKSISRFSNYIIFPVFLSLAFSMIIYLKYHIKYTYSNEFHNILSIIFVFFIIASLVFIFCSKTFLEVIDKFQKKKINPAIEEAKLQKG